MISSNSIVYLLFLREKVFLHSEEVAF
jgi:hypothetical protein